MSYIPKDYRTYTSLFFKMKAIIQGEIHISGGDRRDLLGRISDDTEAVFIEGRDEDIGGRPLTFGYMIFLLGVLLFLWGQGAVSRFTSPGVKDIIRERGIPVYDEIDRGYAGLYEDYPQWLKLIYGFVAVLVFLWALAMPADFRVFQVGKVLLNPTFVERFLMLILPVVGYSGIYILLEGRFVDARDEVMANNILELCEKNGHDEIVVSCGQSHLKPIVDRLEANGRDVAPYDTNHKLLAKIYRDPLLEEG